MKILQDNYDRSFAYLRLSVTDACNFRCKYCLPNGYRGLQSPNSSANERLTETEILNLVSGFARLGIRKVRITGGEPTIRKDIVSIVQKIARHPSIEVVALTTNAYRLDTMLADFKSAGLGAINISLDSLNREDFQEITGYRNFDRVYKSILDAIALGFQSVKINVVMLKTYLERNLSDFMEFVRIHPVSVRFIELMETGSNSDFFQREYISGETLTNKLIELGWGRLKRSLISGPAFEYSHDNYRGKIGVISPYSKDFCSNCNRLRVSSRGKLKLCLFGDSETSIRHLLQSSDDGDELAEYVRILVQGKEASHRLHEGYFGSTESLSSIGG